MSFAFVHPYTLEAAENWIAMNLTYPVTNYVLCEKNEPTIVIGSVGLKLCGDTASHTAELGYWLGEPWQSKGMMEKRWKPSQNGVSPVAHTLHQQKKEPERSRLGCMLLWAEGVMKGHVEKYGVTYDMHGFGLVKADWEEWKRREEGRS